MTYAEIETYLKAYGVDTKKPTSGVNSKWVYFKELLAGDEPEELHFSESPTSLGFRTTMWLRNRDAHLKLRSGSHFTSSSFLVTSPRLRPPSGNLKLRSVSWDLCLS